MPRLRKLMRSQKIMGNGDMVFFDGEWREGRKGSELRKKGMVEVGSILAGPQCGGPQFSERQLEMA